MGTYVTKYKTENGKTRKVKNDPAGKTGGKNGASDANSGAANNEQTKENKK